MPHKHARERLIYCTGIDREGMPCGAQIAARVAGLIVISHGGMETVAERVHSITCSRCGNTTAITPAAPEPEPLPSGVAERFLRGALSGGPRPTALIMQSADELGIAPRTLARVRARLGVQAERAGGQWYLRLPDDNAKVGTLAVQNRRHSGTLSGTLRQGRAVA